MSKNRQVFLSTERQIILIFAVTTLASIVLVGAALYFFLLRTELAQCRTYLQAQATMLARQCESEITEAKQDLEFLARTSAFQQLQYTDRIDVSINGVPENVEVEKRHLLTKLMNKADRFSVLYVLKPNADIYVLEPFRVQTAIKKHNMSDRSYYQEAARTKKTVISDGFFGAEGILASVVLVPIFNNAGDVKAYLGGVFYLSRLSQLLDKERIKPFDAGFLVDRQGFLIAHTDTAMLQAGIRENFIKQHPLVAEFYASKVSTAAAKQEAVFLVECASPADNKPHLSAFVPLRMGWSLVLMRDRASVMAEIRPVIWGITSLVGLLLALIGGLGVVIAHGIGQRWETTERALRSSEERFRITSQSITDVIWEWDLVSGKLDWFGNIDGLLGYGPGEFPRTIQAWEELICPDDRERVMAALDQHITSNDRYDQEYRVSKKNGDTAYWHDRGTVVRNDKGAAIRMFGSVSDITERERAKKELHRLNAELEQRVLDRTAQLEAANKELEAFSYSVSHDLRAPLRAIEGFSRIVTDDYTDKLGAEGNRLLNVICSNIKKMDQLITDLLALSRVGRSELLHARIDMTTLAHSIYHEIANPEILKKFSFSVLPLPDVQGDATLLRQVWSNLISNAIKFAAPKDRPAIEISSKTEQGMNIYYVKDNGVGFNPEYTHKLFGVFQRLHKASEFEGTGIGLAIVQRISHRHNGTVGAEGRMNEGATFWFAVPDRQ